MRTIGVGVAVNAAGSGSVEERTANIIRVGVGVTESGTAIGAGGIDENAASITIGGVVITAFAVRLVCGKGASDPQRVVRKASRTKKERENNK